MGIDSYIADASELRSIIKETPNPKAITTTVMPNGDVEIDAHRYQHGLNGKNAAARDLASPDVFLKYMAGACQQSLEGCAPGLTRRRSEGDRNGSEGCNERRWYRFKGC